MPEFDPAIVGMVQFDLSYSYASQTWIIYQGLYAVFFLYKLLGNYNLMITAYTDSSFIILGWRTKVNFLFVSMVSVVSERENET